MDISKITLGTAQLGMKYGIANINGKPDFKSALNLLNFSYKNGITSFDTAPAYGNSEDIIGTYLSKKNSKENEKIIITTKLPAIKISSVVNFDNLYEHIKTRLKSSLSRLRIKQIQIYLLHHAPDILLKDGLAIKCLEQLKKEGYIQKLGVSTYNLSEIEACLDFNELNVIQIPINLFDHRLIKSTIFDKLKKKKFTILARSIYLQGLFFAPLNKLSKNLTISIKYLTILKKICTEYQIDIAKLAFLFVRDIPGVTSMLIGAEKIEQMAKNVSYLKEEPLDIEIRKRIFEEFSEVPDIIINPSLWNNFTN